MNAPPIDPLFVNDQAGKIHVDPRSMDDPKMRPMGSQSDPNINKGPSTRSSQRDGGALATQSTPHASRSELKSVTFRPQPQQSRDQVPELNPSSSNIQAHAGKQPTDSESDTADFDPNNAAPSSSPPERPESSVTSLFARDRSLRPRLGFDPNFSLGHGSNVESEKSSSPQPRSEPSRPNTPLSGADSMSSGTGNTLRRSRTTEEKPEDLRHHDSSIFSVSFHKGNQRILKARTLAPVITPDQQQLYTDNMMERLSRPQTQADDEVVRKHFPPGHISPLKHVRPDGWPWATKPQEDSPLLVSLRQGP